MDTLEPDVGYTPDCPVKLCADILSGKWTTLIIREFPGGTRRYSQLQYALLGGSPKILAARLRMLESEGLVTRKVYPTVPPKTEYTLTGLGREAEQVIRAMADFGILLAKRKNTAP